MSRVSIGTNMHLKVWLRGAVLLSSIALTACQTSGPGGLLSSVLPDKKPATPAVVPGDQVATLPGENPNAGNRLKNTRTDLTDYCPAVRIRTGTETYRTFPKGADKKDKDLIKHQATIIKVARECQYVGDQLRIKVGAKGRLITGPKGGPGNIKMPIRVAVTQGDKTVYSKLHRPVETIPPGGTYASFSFVDDQISISAPSTKNVRMYIGFDEGPYNTP